MRSLKLRRAKFDERRRLFTIGGDGLGGAGSVRESPAQVDALVVALVKVVERRREGGVRARDVARAPESPSEEHATQIRLERLARQRPAVHHLTVEPVAQGDERVHVHLRGVSGDGPVMDPKALGVLAGERRADGHPRESQVDDEIDARHHAEDGGELLGLLERVVVLPGLTGERGGANLDLAVALVGGELEGVGDDLERGVDRRRHRSEDGVGASLPRGEGGVDDVAGGAKLHVGGGGDARALLGVRDGERLGRGQLLRLLLELRFRGVDRLELRFPLGRFRRVLLGRGEAAKPRLHREVACRQAIDILQAERLDAPVRGGHDAGERHA